MELERYVVPFAIYNFAEMGWIYTTWSLMVWWMLYDMPMHWRQKDIMMFGHHAVTIFICYWLIFFESENILVNWAKVAGLLELSGCSTTIYNKMSSKGYWDKMTMITFYCPIRFWHVPRLLMDLSSVGACRVPLTCVWFIVFMSAWWVRRMFLSALAGTIGRSQPMIQYLASF